MEEQLPRVLAGSLLSLSGIGVIDFYTIVNRKTRDKGRLAHWLLGWLLAIPGMGAVAIGWTLLCTTEPRASFPETVRAGGVALCLIGAALFILSNHRVGRLQSPSRYSLKLYTGGIYRWVRHPQALALCVLCVGLGLASGSVPYLWSVPVWVANWVAYTYFEEHFELIPAFGDDYLRYKETTARLIPWVY